MATKKATKKKAPKKKVAKKKAVKRPAAAVAGEDVRHRVHLHNCTKHPACWTIVGGGSKEKGVSPPMGHSTVRVCHGRRYSVTMWKDPKKKEKAKVEPTGTAIYTGRKILVTHPH